MRFAKASAALVAALAIGCAALHERADATGMPGGGASLHPVVLAAASAAPRDESAQQLLREAIDAPDRLSYAGLVQNVEYGTARSEASMFRIEHRSPDLTRRWYVAPEALYGDQILSHGDTTYDVDVRKKKVIVTKNDAIDDQVALDDNFNLLMRNYRPVFAPEDSVAGRPVVGVVLVNRYTGQTVMRVWLDAQTKLVLEKERYASNGSVTHQSRFEQIRYTSDLPKALFDVPKNGYAESQGNSHGAPSSDLSAVVRAAGFAAKGPKYLPDGFVPVSGDVTDIKGVRSVHLLYSDGIRTISLFENARGSAVDLGRYSVHATRVEDHDAQYVQDGSTTLLTWAGDNNLHFALVGELSRDELVRIAASV